MLGDGLEEVLGEVRVAELEAEVAALKAANWGAGIEIRDLKAKLNVANEQIHMIMQQPNAAPSNGGNDDVVAIPLFEAIDATLQITDSGEELIEASPIGLPQFLLHPGRILPDEIKDARTTLDADLASGGLDGGAVFFGERHGIRPACA